MWVPVNSQIQATIPFKVSNTKLVLQDGEINLDDFTEMEDETIFKLEQQPVKPYEKDYDVQVDFTVEMNLDQVVIARTRYTWLDWMADIGGMQGLLMSGIAYLLTIWNFNHFDNYMVTRLYKMEKADADKQAFESFWSRSRFVLPRKCFNPKEYLCSLIPRWLRCCGCCRPNREERYFQVAR